MKFKHCYVGNYPHLSKWNHLLDSSHQHRDMVLVYLPISEAVQMYTAIIRTSYMSSYQIYSQLIYNYILHLLNLSLEHRKLQHRKVDLVYLPISDAVQMYTAIIRTSYFTITYYIHINCCILVLMCFSCAIWWRAIKSGWNSHAHKIPIAKMIDNFVEPLLGWFLIMV